MKNYIMLQSHHPCPELFKPHLVAILRLELVLYEVCVHVVVVKETLQVVLPADLKQGERGVKRKENNVSI